MLWQLADHQGSIRDVVDSYGTLRKRVEYDSFGQRIYDLYYDKAENLIGGADPSTHAEAVEQLFGYTGREWDKDAELQHNAARWYDPAIGRWLSEDPSGFDGGDPNLYRYVGNSPLNATDPTGLRQAGNSLDALLKNPLPSFTTKVDAAVHRQAIVNGPWYSDVFVGFNYNEPIAPARSIVQARIVLWRADSHHYPLDSTINLAARWAAARRVGIHCWRRRCRAACRGKVCPSEYSARDADSWITERQPEVP